MTVDTENPKDASRATRGSCCAWKIAVALLFLRLCVGWHFFAEGIKKLSYDEGRQQWSMNVPTEFMFGQAVGPLAGFYHSFVPGDHKWRTALATPEQLTPESAKKLSGWVSGYVKRRQQELKTGKHTEVAIPDFVPYAEWHEEIDEERRELFEQFAEVSGLDEEQLKQAGEIYERRNRQLADYLAGESLEIQTYQHELWRLENMTRESGAEEIPYRAQRALQTQTETSNDPRRWVATVKVYDEEFTNELKSILTAEQAESPLAAEVDEALTSPTAKTLHRMNVAATCLTIGVGLCLLVGLFTRLASVLGIVFLLSVMATQPPWVPGAQTMLFYYQLVEVAAFAVLATTRAGRVAGLDFVLHGLWSKCCGSK